MYPNQQSLKVVGTYPYHDEQGNLLFQVVRYEPKDFRQRRPDPDGKGGWIWDTKDVRKVLYRLPEILNRKEQPVLIVEGERKADALAALGFVATCSPGGAGKFTFEHAETLFGRRIAIFPDYDEPGFLHAAMVAGKCMMHGVKSVRIVRLPGLRDKEDVLDWLEEFKPETTLEQKKRALVDAIRASSEWALQRVLQS